VTNVALLHFGAEKVRTFLKTTTPFFDIFDAKKLAAKDDKSQEIFSIYSVPRKCKDINAQTVTGRFPKRIRIFTCS